MKRRGNREGHIRERADGRWVAQIRIKDPLTGLTKRAHLYGRTRGAVLDKMRMLQARVRSGEPAQDARLTVSELMNRWLDDVAKPKVKPKVYALYEAVNRLHLQPALGDYLIAHLQPAMIEHALTGAGAKGSARMRQLAIVILKAALKTAVRWRLLARSPADDVRAPTATKRSVHPLSQAQVKTFLAASRSRRLYAVYVVAIFAGARQGEILALRWSDVDLKRGRIRIHGTLDAKTRTVTDPKTVRSLRTIAVPKGVCAALEAHRRKMQSEGRDSIFTFVSAAGTPLSARNVVRDFKAALTAAKLPTTFRFQDLRHTYATLSLLAGVPLKVVSEQLGHASIQITADTYTHVLPAMQTDAANALGRLFSQRVSQNGGRNGGQQKTAGKARTTGNEKKPVVTGF